jgi:hypothetical protein
MLPAMKDAEIVNEKDGAGPHLGRTFIILFLMVLLINYPKFDLSLRLIDQLCKMLVGFVEENAFLCIGEWGYTSKQLNV